ncbi:unnamed protein product [Orchesella dallaii]|uniref:Uncharacterized protein n=1 Tax=Orchesella dallaii TaxID=48710 RepID=A0ABP1RPS2_9HEXA
MEFNKVSLFLVVSLASCCYLAGALPVSEIVETNSSENDTNVIRPEFRMHNNMNGPSTFSVLVSRSVPSIWPYYDDLNTIAGHCVTGTWITYGFSNYTAGEFSVGGLIFSSATESCTGKMWPTFSSFRLVGSPLDIHASTLTTFEGPGYRGKLTVYSEDQPTLTEPLFGSLIVTGGSPITFFSRENFQGFQVCIDSPENGVGGGIREAARTLGLLPEDIKSIRFSCNDSVTRVSLERNSG